MQKVHPAKASVPLVGFIAILSLCFALSTQQAYAASPSENLSPLSRKKVSITAFDHSYKLLDEFMDEQAALSTFKSEHPTFLEQAEDYGLPELSVENASLYKSYAMSLEGSIENDEWAAILAFLDIYENPESNEEIEEKVRLLEIQANSNGLSTEEAISKAEKLLPISNSPSTVTVEPLNSGINLAAARDYAERYAVHPNSKYGYETTWLGIGADCTNFASQILYAGGVAMDTSYNTNEGWWWRATNQRSVSWIQAATFARYMGSGYNTTSWSSLVSNARAGDFIGYDSGGDGEVDHIGFVHSKTGNELYIAQHTNDYIDWDNNTGWPDIDGRYYRIRR